MAYFPPVSHRYVNKHLEVTLQEVAPKSRMHFEVVEQTLAVPNDATRGTFYATAVTLLRRLWDEALKNIQMSADAPYKAAHESLNSGDNSARWSGCHIARPSSAASRRLRHCITRHNSSHLCVNAQGAQECCNGGTF